MAERHHFHGCGNKRSLATRFAVIKQHIFHFRARKIVYLVLRHNSILIHDGKSDREGHIVYNISRVCGVKYNQRHNSDF